ncbi:hypothetical protein A374_15968 [Fictibacillus macauensis ZFHKF-1]|uniref:Uncharacterized protein n=1 Tax=Fictibacillus macauensis ZFHKF-1 TaxID=1196324 RepID=I8UBX7_9BACL|nr:DUF3574 domain-containing protein [Fictibacillus macauensis]EIT84298.1 hypothetical protein A374_15968 [Fictibacillus macauensis ZFHKF-1]
MGQFKGGSGSGSGGGFNFSRGTSYLITVGINDGDTNCQPIPTAQALAYIERVCSVTFPNGYTVIESVTGYTDQRTGKPYVQTSFVINVLNTTEAEVLECVSLYSQRFNQRILVERFNVEYTYYK